MIEALRVWVMRLTAAAVLSALALGLTPEGSVKKVVRLVCGLLTITALLSFAIKFDMDTFSKATADYRQRGETIAEQAQAANRELLRRSIEEQCVAYIWDKAYALGIELTKAEVSAAWSEDGYWYPTEAILAGECTTAQREELTMSIEAELGIAREKQVWRAENED